MKTGLVLEGGAMRGLFTAGVLDVLMENNIDFDGAVGVSAGACFGINYKSHQIGRTIRYNMRYCQDKRYGFVARMRVKNQELLLLKPSTYMNLSGNAVRYWMNKENIPLERLLVVVDDIALPFGTIRMKPGGSEGGHNGLRSISQQLATQQYARLRFGIGSDFQHGNQIDYVLGEFSDEELTHMDERVALAADAVKAYALSGLNFAMNNYNNK